MTRQANAKTDVVIFGTGAFAEVVHFYLTHDSAHNVVAFTATADSISEDKFLDRPIVDFDTVEQHFPPETHAMFIAMGYRKLNRLREQFFELAKAKQYDLVSYICSKATHWGDTNLGKNVFVFENNTIQPFVSIGDNTVLWSGNHIGHHSTIGSHCFISSHVVVSGYCKIGSHCFLGVNATIADGVAVGDHNIIGPNALIQKDTNGNDVYIAERTPKFARDSSRFFK